MVPDNSENHLDFFFLFPSLSPALLPFSKAANSMRDSGVHYIELSPSFQAKINLPSLVAPTGGREEKKMGGEGKKLAGPISAG